MPYTHAKSMRHLGFIRGFTWRLLAAAASAVVLVPAAHATNITETTDFSNDPAKPSFYLAPVSLTLGSNIITGAINTYGSTTNPDGTPVGPHGELTNQDMDYLTFTVPAGNAITQFIVSNGTSIMTSPRVDSLFLGLASGNHVSVDPLFNSAVGLLGWTLVTQSELGTDILPSISNPLKDPALKNFPVPGATTFTPPLGAGTYTLWLYDGDAGATYSFNAVVAPVPEPATWAMMIVGLGVIGFGLRRRSRQPVRVTYA